MNTKAVAHQYKLNHWTALIQESSSSGKKVKDWCCENNISKDTYYYWFKEVRKAATISRQPLLVIIRLIYAVINTGKGL